MLARTRRRRRADPAPANGFLVPVGTPRWFQGLTRLGIVVVGEQGQRCAILTRVGHQDLHRALLTGARNLGIIATRLGSAAFTEAGVLDGMARHLPPGFGMGPAQPVQLRDVHGTGRIHFSRLVGGLAHDDEVEAPPPALGIAAPPPSGNSAPRTTEGRIAARPPPGCG